MAQARMRLAVLTGTLVLVVSAASCLGSKAETCSQCGRDECKNLAFTVNLSGGGSVRTCCPRCALRYLDAERPAVASLEVRDFESATVLDARHAVYVEDSDAHPCQHRQVDAPKDERGCCLKPVFDRCEPSLIAFASADRAESFAREHGGFLKTFVQLTDERRRAPRTHEP